MDEIIPFPKTPPEPTPPREPAPGEEPPENVIFPKKFQGRREETTRNPEENKLALEEMNKVWEIWKLILASTSGKGVMPTKDGWWYYTQRRDRIVDISQTEPKEGQDGIILVKNVEGKPPKQTLTTMQILFSYFENGQPKRDRVNITQVKRTVSKSESTEATIGVVFAEDGGVVESWRDNAEKGLEIASQLKTTALEELAKET